jgi:hypothetical protein
MTKVGAMTAAAGSSAVDVGAGQAAAGRTIAAAKDTGDIATAQALMRYGAGIASANTMRAAATAAQQAGQTQSDLVNRIASITGQRAISEGDIAGALAQRTTDIATPVETLKGNLAGQLALASGGVAQAQYSASETNALMAAQQAAQQARAGAIGTGISGLFSILGRGFV